MSSPPSRLKPYLTTAQLISLAVLASPVISLIFVLFRLQSSSGAAQNSIEDTKGSVVASCKAAEHAASVGASLPRFLAQGTNEQITHAVRGTIEGVRLALTLSLVATEAIIEFMIDIYRSTLLCFLELVVRGGLSIIIAAVGEITGFLNTTLSSITSGIANDIGAANKVISAAVDVANKIPFVNIKIPLITIPSADKLANIQIPTDFEDSLKKLNSSIPTLAELRDKLDNLIAVPFTLVKTQINETLAEAQKNFIATPLPVPEASTVSFCGDLVDSSFDNLAKDIAGVARTGFILILVAIFLVFLGFALWTWYQQRTLRQLIERLRNMWFSDAAFATNDQLMSFNSMVEHPFWTRIVLFFSDKFHLTTSGRDALAWWGVYVFHPLPLACLFIGIFGLITVQIQLLALRPLVGHYSNEIHQAIGDLSSKIATSLNETMIAESASYAQAMNAKIIAVETGINQDMFGWVNNTIVPLNTTLATFYSEVQSVVSTLFGKTPLDAPAQEFVRCILGSKIETLERALTFLQEQLVVDLPRMDNNSLVLSPERVSEVTKPISAAAVGSGDNGDDGGLLGKILTRYISSLEKERITFFIFLILWVLFAVIGLGIVAYHLWVIPAAVKMSGQEGSGRGWANSIATWGNKPGTRRGSSSTARSDDATLEEKGQIAGAPRKGMGYNVHSDLSVQKSFDKPLKSPRLQPDTDRLRQRRGSQGHADNNFDLLMASMQDMEKSESKVMARLKTFAAKRKGPGETKADSGVLPAPVSLSSVPSEGHRDEKSGEWLKRMTFWKRPNDPAEGTVIPYHESPKSHRSDFSNNATQPKHPGSSTKRDRTSPMESSLLPYRNDRSPQDIGRSRKDISLPAPLAPKFPEKRGLPSAPNQFIVRTGKSDRGRSRTGSGEPGRSKATNRDSGRNRSSNQERRREERPNADSSRRPYGVGPALDGRYPALAPQLSPPAKQRSHQRTSSVPPAPGRNLTDPRKQYQVNRAVSRRSSYEAVDPFASPISMVHPLLSPMKPAPAPVSVPSTKPTNPFETPFDDSYAVTTEPGAMSSYNFSFPTRR